MTADAAGVYQILNTTNNHRYIGSSTHILLRWQQHRYDLQRGAHYNLYLQRAWNHYGEAAFAFQVLENADAPGVLLEREQHHLDVLQPEYNIALVVGSPMRGRTHSEETKRKMSAAKMGHTLSEASKRRIGEASRRRRMWASPGSREASLTDKEIWEIKSLLSLPFSFRDIAARYGIRESTVRSIWVGKLWCYIKGEGTLQEHPMPPRFTRSEDDWHGLELLLCCWWRQKQWSAA